MESYVFQSPISRVGTLKFERMKLCHGSGLLVIGRHRPNVWAIWMKAVQWLYKGGGEGWGGELGMVPKPADRQTLTLSTFGDSVAFSDVYLQGAHASHTKFRT